MAQHIPVAMVKSCAHLNEHTATPMLRAPGDSSLELSVMSFPHMMQSRAFGAGGSLAGFDGGLLMACGPSCSAPGESVAPAKLVPISCPSPCLSKP